MAKDSARLCQLGGGWCGFESYLFAPHISDPKRTFVARPYNCEAAPALAVRILADTRAASEQEGTPARYCIEIVIPLRLSEASSPIAGPRTCMTTPFAFRSVATLPPPTIASAAEPWLYVPTMSAAVRRFEAVPTRSTADAPVVLTCRPPILSRYFCPLNFSVPDPPPMPTMNPALTI